MRLEFGMTNIIKKIKLQALIANKTNQHRDGYVSSLRDSKLRTPIKIISDAISPSLHFPP